METFFIRSPEDAEAAPSDFGLADLQSVRLIVAVGLLGTDLPHRSRPAAQKSFVFRLDWRTFSACLAVALVSGSCIAESRQIFKACTGSGDRGSYGFRCAADTVGRVDDQILAATGKC